MSSRETVIYALVSNDYGDSFYTIPPLTDPFPMMDGVGDYAASLDNGLPGGFLFPTWAQPVVSSASGEPCKTCPDGNNYSMQITAAMVRP